jgi:hypothetical protein
MAVFLNVFPALGPTNHGTTRDDENIDQLVALIGRMKRARIA